MEINISTDGINPEWNAFVEQVGESHFEQSGYWAEVRAIQGWRSYQITLLDEGVIKAGAQILIRPMKFFGWVGYIPYGFLNPQRDPTLDEKIIRAIQETCQNKHIHYLATSYPSGQSDDYLDLGRYGFKPGLLGDIDPPCTIYLDLSPEAEEIIGSMDRNKRNQVRASQKRGLIFREGSRGEIEEFYRLHQMDSRRIGYQPFDKNFFYKIWDVYTPLGKVNLFVTELDGKIINAGINIGHRDTLIGYKIGWSGEERHRYPNEAINWGAILWAKAHGYRFYDYGGLESWALDFIKKGKPYPEKFIQTYAYFKYQMSNAMEIFPPVYEYIYHPFIRWCYFTFMPILWRSDLIKKIIRLFRHTGKPVEKRGSDHPD